MPLFVVFRSKSSRVEIKYTVLLYKKDLQDSKSNYTRDNNNPGDIIKDIQDNLHNALSDYCKELDVSKFLNIPYQCQQSILHVKGMRKH